MGLSAEGAPHEAPIAAPPLPPKAPAAPKTAAPSNGSPASSAPPAAPLSGPLGDLFEEFRSELGEVAKEDEDLETHYNLGIAYREMGLLEEAISEFQKVASSADKGPAFRYAMQCSTLLGLAFMEKGQPAIAAIWYERALKTPGLDQESILALRYDLGVAQESAGNAEAAFQSFSQVYAMISTTGMSPNELPFSERRARLSSDEDFSARVAITRRLFTGSDAHSCSLVGILGS